MKIGNSGQKWFGCILGMGRANRGSLDLQHHLQAASRAFFAHKQILCDQRVRVKDRLRCFVIVIIPVAMSGCGHRTVYQSDLCRMDVLFRKLLRMVVGAPGNLDWSRPWHEILHEWNMKAQTIVSEHQVKLWSHRCIESYWKLGLYIANLPPERWVQRALHWKPAVHVLQDILDMTGHQNFNRTPGTRMIGTLWHPTRNCGHT